MANAESFRPTHQVSRGWLWLVRVLTVLFGLASLLLAVSITGSFLQEVSGDWRSRRAWIGLALCLLLILCAGAPYGLAAWNLRGDRVRRTGSFQTVVLGAFWFFLEWSFLADLSFQGWPSWGSLGAAGSLSETLSIVVRVALLTMLPGLLLLVGGAKISNAREPLLAGSETTVTQPRVSALRRGVVAVLALMAIPPSLSIITLTSIPSATQFSMVEALLLAGMAPYAIVLRSLLRPGVSARAGQKAGALAAGFITLLVLAGGFSAFSAFSIRHWRPRGFSIWAELAFFVLVCFASLVVLMAGLRLGQQSGATRQNRLSLCSIFPICLCLFAFAFLLMWYVESV